MRRVRVRNSVLQLVSFDRECFPLGGPRILRYKGGDLMRSRELVAREAKEESIGHPGQWRCPDEVRRD